MIELKLALLPAAWFLKDFLERFIKGPKTNESNYLRKQSNYFKYWLQHNSNFLYVISRVYDSVPVAFVLTLEMALFNSSFMILSFSW